MSDFIPEDFIQKVLEDSDIVSLVDSYVPLKRKGKDHWAQCPFCDDGSNPSFSVSDQKQFYYCFKCRASGNAIGFLMNYQSKDFVGAVEILAKNLGLEIPRTKSNYEREKFDEIPKKVLIVLSASGVIITKHFPVSPSSSLPSNKLVSTLCLTKSSL